FFGFLGTNIVLVTILASTAVLMDYWNRAYGKTLSIVAVALSLLALTLRLALTQYHQHKEIAQRKKAQEELAISHQNVASLLETSQRQTAEITIINNLGNQLQTCSSREEVFSSIPERMLALFPGSLGTLSVFNTSRSRAEVVAFWGMDAPPDLS